MAVADPSMSADLRHPDMNISPRPPHILSPIPNSMRSLSPNSNRMLPLISQSRGRSGSVMRTEAQPSSLVPAKNDFLPADLLTTLKRQSPGEDVVAGPYSSAVMRHPLLKAGTLAHTGNYPKNHPPANLWNYTSRRSKLKHLTDSPPCICGAGRDISFLYNADVKHKEEVQDKHVLSNSLIPEDYHLVKQPGVLGLEFHEDHYTTRSEHHDHHMTIFPSMNPAGRQEAITLKHTLDKMLHRAAVPYELKDSDLKGPTEMHNLLELLQKEQTIYNVCFHELIRQTSVHCVERGELLADIRRRYNNLLDRIPRQVKSLHDELVAYRSLDKKLSTELKKFKNRIASLTEDLSGVREHNLHVTEQSKIAENNLSTALSDSEKNSSLLTEYHALYELQRKRLKDQVSSLTFERDLWQQASCDLAKRVTDECNLQTLQRIQLYANSWYKLAGHFTVLLGDREMQELSEVQSCVQQWREQMIGITHKMKKMESEMKEKLVKVEKGMQCWSEQLNSITDSDGVVYPPDKAVIQQLFSELKIWQMVINKELDNFAGDSLINNLEEIASLTLLVEQWTKLSVKLFTRHQQDDDNGEHTTKNEQMLALNISISGALKECRERVSGENGVATGFIHVITPLETWDTKLSLCLTSKKDKSSLHTSDWIKFCTLLKEWRSQIHNIIGYIGTVIEPTITSQPEAISDDSVSQKENVEGDNSSVVDETNSPFHQLTMKVEKWRSALFYAIGNQNSLITEQVDTFHSSLLKWIIELLLWLTNTRVSQEHDTSHRQQIISTSNLKADFKELSSTLTTFNKMLSRACTDIVRDIVNKRIQDDYPKPEEEAVELKRLGNEANECLKLSGLILEGVDGVLESDGAKMEEEKNSSGASGSGDQADKLTDGVAATEGDTSVPDQLPELMSVLGVDDNIHAKSFQQALDETELPPISSSVELGLATEEVMPEGRRVKDKEAEALVIALDDSNKKLMEQESLAKQEEERVQSAKKELEEAKSRISELEDELQAAKASLEELIYSKESGRGPKKSLRGNAVKKTTPGNRRN